MKLFYLIFILACSSQGNLQKHQEKIEIIFLDCLKGNCPVYEISIQANGIGLYRGVKNVRRQGIYNFTVKKMDFNDLRTGIEKLLNSSETIIRDRALVKLYYGKKKIKLNAYKLPKNIKRICKKILSEI